MSDRREDEVGVVQTLVERREEAAPGHGPSVDRVVARGRRRVRRRRAVVGAGAAAALVVVGSVSGYAWDQLRPSPAPPAGDGSGITACSFAPETCSPEEVDAWIEAAAGVTVGESDVFGDPPGIPGDAYIYRPFLRDDVELDVAVRTTGPAADLDFFDEPGRLTGRGVELPGEVTRWDCSTSPQCIAWGVDAGARGAALVVWDPVGGGGAEGGDVVTDEEATALLRGLTGG